MPSIPSWALAPAEPSSDTHPSRPRAEKRKRWNAWDFAGLVNIQKANWNMAMEVVDLPMKNGDFPVRYVNVYQRVAWLNSTKTLEFHLQLSGIKGFIMGVKRMHSTSVPWYRSLRHCVPFSYSLESILFGRRNCMYCMTSLFGYLDHFERHWCFLYGAKS